MTPDKATALREAAERANAPEPSTRLAWAKWEYRMRQFENLDDPPTILALLAERERLRAFALAYRRKMEVGIAGMTDEEIQTLRLAWDYASAALETTDA